MSLKEEEIISNVGFTQETANTSKGLFQNCLSRWRRTRQDTKLEEKNGTMPSSLDFCILDARFSTEKFPSPESDPEFSSKYHSLSFDAFSKSQVNFDSLEMPVIQLFGSTKTGTTVLIHVHGFFPYIYCEAPKSTAPNPQKIKSQIESNSIGMPEGKLRVLNVEVIKKESIMYFKDDTEEGCSNFYKITLQLPNSVPTCRSFIENGNLDCFPQAYEANIPFILRFLIDNDLSTGSWVSVPKKHSLVRNSREFNLKESGYHKTSPFKSVSSCQIEIDIFFDELQVLGTSGEWAALPPIRVLSFDIECITESGVGFPEPQKDSVIQISSVVTLLDSPESICNVVFTLKECASVAEAFIFWFESEKDMLLAWKEFLLATDPDVLTGYNCINFDMHYLLERAKVFQLNEFFFFTRLIKVKVNSKETRFSSRAFGTHESKLINIEGRILWDILETIRREHKLKSYSLNYVSTTFLKEQKEDVHYSMIRGLQDGNPETRKRIAVYCLKDSLLPLRLMRHLKLFPNIIEMARVTGTTIDILLSRGQQIKVTSQILRKCKLTNFLMPTVKNQSDGENQFEGATVLEPLKGFYKEPISTLDFASLYPSIMIAHNICYSTLVPPSMLKSVPEELRKASPAGHHFVAPSVRKGILPLIVEELIAARKKAKKEMAEASDPTLISILDGRQLALKISANSVYGFTGAVAGGQLPCLELSTSITSYGRVMIDITKGEVEKVFRKENGYPADAKVVYGDTDSVMIQFGVSEIKEAMKLGLEAATTISKLFTPPIKLEFEKVYCPFLLMNKKRYAGVLYKNPEIHERIDCKGIETVRRDNCLLVQKVVDAALRKILVEKDVEAAKQYTKNIISDLLRNRVDLSLLVVSKSLGKEDYTAKLPHVELAKKLRQRDPGSAPNIGDRVSYVVIKGSKGQPQYDRAEDPLYVLEKNLAIDTQHYVDALKSSVIRIFEGVMKDPEKLFSGSHTRSVTVLSVTGGALAGFVKKGLQCLNCKTNIKEGAFCKDCSKQENIETSLLVTKLHEHREKEIEYNSLWTQCQRCQGSTFQDVICTSRDCPIFYRRTKVRKDVGALGEQIKRLDLGW
ncbi:putative DNA polymerase delta catalytic subunit [Cryptosporidium felis]|nr:putative DNA polymerase delta catalytic subunit [Cryptosporidium felis]